MNTERPCKDCGRGYPKDETPWGPGAGVGCKRRGATQFIWADCTCPDFEPKPCPWEKEAEQTAKEWRSCPDMDIILAVARALKAKFGKEEP